MDRNHYLYDNKGNIINIKNNKYCHPVEYVRYLFEKYKISELDDMFTDSIKNNSFKTKTI